LSLQGKAGRLEARLRPLPRDHPPRRAAVLLHPHPLYGGTLHNKILYRIAKRLPLEADTAALRLQFRGSGKSEGRHDGGCGEVDDVDTALDWLADRYRGLPLAVIGYSFGAMVGLEAGVDDHRVEMMAGLGLPVRLPYDFSFLERIRIPWLLVHGEMDEFGTAPELAEFVRGLPHPPRIEVVKGAGHLFIGQEDEAVDAVISFFRKS